MEKITLIFLLFLAQALTAQDKLSTPNGTVNFEASVPYFEEVKAVNNKVSCVISTRNSEISCVVQIEDFEFKRDLMKDHFNEKYLESKRYPKATFKGIIEKFDLKNIDDTSKEYLIKGKIEIHGKSKPIVVKAVIQKTAKGIVLKSNFNLNTDDFKIKIPDLVIAKVSKTVNTQLHFVLK